jgi:hypothetical protein
MEDPAFHPGAGLLMASIIDEAIHRDALIGVSVSPQMAIGAVGAETAWKIFNWRETRRPRLAAGALARRSPITIDGRMIV